MFSQLSQGKVIFEWYRIPVNILSRLRTHRVTSWSQFVWDFPSLSLESPCVGQTKGLVTPLTCDPVNDATPTPFKAARNGSQSRSLRRVGVPTGTSKHAPLCCRFFKAPGHLGQSQPHRVNLFSNPCRPEAGGCYNLPFCNGWSSGWERTMRQPSGEGSRMLVPRAWLRGSTRGRARSERGARCRGLCRRIPGWLHFSVWT